MKSATGARRSSANRRNARRSTGPRTPEGKARVSLNALKHGLLAKEILIKRGDGKESEEEFVQLFEAFEADLKPSGRAEYMLLEFIVAAYYRRRRVLHYETAALRANLDNAMLDDYRHRRSAFKLALSQLRSTGSSEKLRECSMGVSFLIATLERAREELVATGCMSLETWQNVDLCFRTQKLGPKCSGFIVGDACPGIGVDGQRRVDGAKLDEPRIDFLEELLYEVDQLEALRHAVEEVEALALERAMGLGSLPSSEAAERILRYETTLERRVFRALNELLQLRRQRDGAPVTPSPSVDPTMPR